MVSQKDDVIDILLKETTGWQTPPAVPIVKKCDINHKVPAYAKKGTPSILIKTGDTYDSETQNVQLTLEDRETIIGVAIIAKNDDDLYLYQKQTKEVFDRYTNNPWATSTLGTGKTYSLVELINPVEDDRLTWFVIDAEVRLFEELVDVIIA